MKILFVGDLNDYARAKQRYLALQDLNHYVEGIAAYPLNEASSRTLLFLFRKFLKKVLFKLGYPMDETNVNSRVLEKVESLKPDWIWIEKVNTIKPATYKKIKNLLSQVKLTFYSEDDIYLKHNRSVYLKKALPYFDIVYTTKPRNVNELPKLGAKKIYCIYQAYDKKLHRPIDLTEEEKKQWGADVSFVGTFEQERADKMLGLAQQGIQVRIWGNNWQSWKNKHPNLIVEEKAVYNENFVKVINSSKINLNFLRKQNRDLHTSRSLEIPACHGFMLGERTEEHLKLFEEGKEAEFFDNFEELLDKVIFYINNTQLRKSIASAGRQRCISSGYSHQDRLKQMLSIF